MREELALMKAVLVLNLFDVLEPLQTSLQGAYSLLAGCVKVEV